MEQSQLPLNVVWAHGEVGSIPLAQNSPGLELLHLGGDGLRCELTRRLANLERAQWSRRSCLFDLVLLVLAALVVVGGQHFELNGKTVAVPAGGVINGIT